MDDPVLCLKNAIDFAKFGDSATAVKELKELKKKNLTANEKAKVWLGLCFCYDKIGNWNKALKSGIKALNTCKDYDVEIAAAYNVAVLYEKLGKIRESKEFFDKFEQLKRNQKIMNSKEENVKKPSDKTMNKTINNIKKSDVLIDSTKNTEIKMRLLKNRNFIIKKGKSLVLDSEQKKILNNPSKPNISLKISDYKIPAIFFNNIGKYSLKSFKNSKILSNQQKISTTHVKIREKPLNSFYSPKNSLKIIKQKDSKVLSFDDPEPVSSSPYKPHNFSISATENIGTISKPEENCKISSKKSFSSEIDQNSYDFHSESNKTIKSSKNSSKSFYQAEIPEPKAKNELLYSCIKKITQKLCKIRIISKNFKKILEISDPSGYNHKLEIPPQLYTLPYSVLINCIDFQNSFPIILSSPWEFLETRVKTFKDLSVQVDFYYNSFLKKIRVSTFNLYSDFSVNSRNNVNIVRDKVEEVFEFVKFRNNTVVIDNNRYGCIAEGLKEIDGDFFLVRIIREESLGLIDTHSAYKKGLNIRIESIDSSHNIFSFAYTIDEVCEIFGINSDEIDDFIEEMLEKISINKKYIFFGKNRIKCLTLMLLYTANKKIGAKHVFKFFQIVEKDLILITAEPFHTKPTKYITIIQYPKGQSSEKFFLETFRKLSLTGDKLKIIIPNESYLQKSVILIQKHVRKMIAKEKFKLRKKKTQSLVFRSGKKLGNFTILVSVVKNNEGLFVNVHGDLNKKIELPRNLAKMMKEYDIVPKAFEISENKIILNMNLLTFFIKKAKFVLPAELQDFSVLLEKWKEVNEEYCKIMILEFNERYAIVIDRAYKIMTKQELLDIYHEISCECLFDEVTLIKNEIYLDPTIRSKPQIIISRKYIYEESYITVTLRNQIDKNLKKIKILVFDITLKEIHHRIKLDLFTAVTKTGISENFSIPLCNYLIDKGLRISQNSVHLTIFFEKCDLNKLAAKIQKVYRGYFVRKTFGKIQVKSNSFLAAVRRKKVSGFDVMLFAYIHFGKIRIEAVDKDSRLILYFDQSLIKGFSDARKKVIEGTIFENLYIDVSKNLKRLCIKTNIEY